MNDWEDLQLQISLSSPEQIRAESCGAITKSDTIDYKNHKPVVGGLFCPKIFGPPKEEQCMCGRYKGVKYLGTICEKENCQTEVMTKEEQRNRFGHVELNAPVIHPWFFKQKPSILVLLLSNKILDKKSKANIISDLIDYSKYIVIEDYKDIWKAGQTISAVDIQTTMIDYPGLNIQTGAAAIHELLKQVDIDEEVDHWMDVYLQDDSDNNRNRLRYLLDIQESGFDIENIVFLLYSNITCKITANVSN